MKKRKIKEWYKENKQYIRGDAIIVVTIFIGIAIFFAVGIPTENLLLKMQENEFELCEEEARNRYSQIIQVINEQKKSDNFSISYGGYDEMPILIVKTPDNKGKVTAKYKNGKVVIIREMSGIGHFGLIFIIILSELIYILIFRYIYKRNKKRLKAR